MRKKNIQGTNSEGKETRTQINNLEQKGKINIQRQQSEETIIQKNEEKLKNHSNNFKCSNIQILAAPERRKSKNMKTYLKN